MVERPQTASELLSEVRNLRTEILLGQPPPATAPAARGNPNLLGGKKRASAAARSALESPCRRLLPAAALTDSASGSSEA